MTSQPPDSAPSHSPVGEVAPGQVIGKYKVLSCIGHGGMGTVYLAEHVLMGRKAALKVLHAAWAGNEETTARLFKEARALANMRHPCVVEVLDCGTAARGLPYLAMEFLEGETLEQLLARTPMLSVAEAVAITRQIARGIGAAHACGIVHRDLKPSNIFLIGGGSGGGQQVKVLDFGLAKLSAELSGEGISQTRSGTIIGTPLYMSPEQCRGSTDIDTRADVYALGGILYALLCGQPPFPRSNLGEIISAHLSEPVPSPRAFNAAVPRALEAIIAKALEKDRDGRYPDATAFEQALGALDPRLLTTAAPIVKTPPTARPTRRRTFALVGAIVVLGGVSWLVMQRTASVRREVSAGPDRWQPTVLSTFTLSTARVTNLRVVSDVAGGATVFWRLMQGRRESLWVAERAAGGTWAPAHEIVAHEGNIATPTIAGGADGAVAVAWRQEIDRKPALWTATRDARGAWTSGEVVNAASPANKSLDIAVDGVGRTTVIWFESREGVDTVWVARRSPGASWSVPVRLDDPEKDGAREPIVEAANDGSAMALWVQRRGTLRTIRVSRAAPGGTWQPSVDIGDTATDAQQPRLAVSKTGHAAAAWRSPHELGSRVMANHFSPQTGWGSPEVLARPTTTDVGLPEVGVADDGSVVIAWRHPENSLTNVYTRSFRPGRGWSPLVTIDGNDDGDARHPELAMNGAGQAVVVWEQVTTSGSRLWYNAFEADGGWQGPAPLAQGSVAPKGASVAFVGSNAVAAWAELQQGVQRLWAATSDAPVRAQRAKQGR